MTYSEFSGLTPLEKTSYINRLERWDDIDPEFYVCLCDDLGLDYSSYTDPDVMWSAILDSL